METNHFIQALPKAELHLHLEGAVPWEMVRTRVKSWPFPPPWWAEDFRFDDFNHFARVIRQGYESTLTSLDNYYLAAQGVFQNLLAQNVRYTEISFSLGHALAQNLPLAEIVVALKGAAPADLLVRVFCGLSRSRPYLLEHKLLSTLPPHPARAGWPGFTRG